MLHTQSHMHKSSISENGPATYTLPGVLHYLQQEWRRFERERNEWEIERAELKAMMVLEGECRGQDTIKIDLVRRIKMFEHVLRLERVKQLKSGNVDLSSATVESALSPPTLGAESLALTRDSTMLPITPATENSTKSSDAAPLSGSNASIKTALSAQKSRVKSRDVLKLCLQEVDQLTSFCNEQLTNATSAAAAGSIVLPMDEFTVNGLGPNVDAATRNATLAAIDAKYRLRARDDTQLSEETSPTLPPVDSPPTVRLPRIDVDASLSGNSNSGESGGIGTVGSPPPPHGNQRRPRRPSNPTPDDQPGIRSPPQLTSKSLDGVSAFAGTNDYNSGRKRQTIFIPADVDVMAEGAAGDTNSTGSGGSNHPSSTIIAQSPRSPILAGVKVDEIDDENMLEDAVSMNINNSGKLDNKFTSETSGGVTTVIERNGHKNPPQASDFFDYDTVEEITLDQTMINGTDDAEDGQKLWRQRCILQSHLDTVRTIDFHERDFILASGSEDGLVKIWNLSELATSISRTTEYEPRATMRGHQGAIHAVQICGNQNKCFSAGADTAIMVWNMPGTNSELYSPHDATVLRTQFIGHSDIIWDLRLQPSSFEHDTRQLIASAAADGTVKLWDTYEEHSPLRNSFSYEGAESGDNDLTRDINPISVDFSHQNTNQMIVAYGNASLRLFDIETGKLLLECQTPDTCDRTPDTQINRVITHPTSSVAITVSEDQYLRSFDLNSGQCIQSTRAHSDAISSVDIHTTGTTLITGGHDGAVKLWDMRNFKCIQEVGTHRRKLDEGVLQVRFHPTLSWLATGGADSVIKIFS
ncbi:WD40-repeat-containing domain protein [Syncephalis fuscata]|nr:WD40-repeat-containing domain protein [Syncephalis fuscata]